MTIITIATGKPSWGQMALNLALSIKANSEVKTALIYTDSAIKGVEDYLPKYFDYALRIYHNDISSPAELAYYTKTQLYNYAEGMTDDKEFIFLDADTIILPAKDAADWFSELSAVDFTAYCNDVYNYTNKGRKRTDYTFWCKPEEAREYFGIHPNSKMPQINSSFLFWRKTDKIKALFEKASEAWNSDFQCDLYCGCKPDEFAFNVACAVTGIIPHKTSYRPIYLQFQSGVESPEFVQHHYKAFGFAGNGTHDPSLVEWYDRLVKHYLKEEGIKLSFNFKPETKTHNGFAALP